MRAFDLLIFAHLLNSLWQVPLVFCAALAASRLARRAGAQMEHLVWVSALLLETMLPLCHLPMNDLWQRAIGLAFGLFDGSAADGEARVILGAVSPARLALPWQTANLLAASSALYLLGLLYFTVRLVWSLFTTESLRRRAMPLQLNLQTAQRVGRLGINTGLASATVRFAISREISGPATVGLMRHTLLPPPGLLDRLESEDLDAVIAHEFAHMQRRDFAKNLLYSVVALPAAYHPFMFLTRTRVAEARELVCYASAAKTVGGRESYARSLFRLAPMLPDRSAPRILHAIGILDANILERRVMYLTRRSLEVKGAHRLAIAATCVLFAFAACASALALRIEVTEPALQAANSNSSSVHVKADALEAIKRVPPVYPVEAKRDRITGSVILAAIIGKDGTVDNLKVTKSLRPDCDKSALDPVQQWVYNPFFSTGIQSRSRRA